MQLDHHKSCWKHVKTSQLGVAFAEHITPSDKIWVREYGMQASRQVPKWRH